MWESTAATVLALAGVAVVGVRLSGAPPRLGLHTRAVLVAGAVTAALVQLPGMLSTTDIRNSQTAERDGYSKLALAHARDAVSAEGWSASAHEQEALVLEASGRLNQALHQETLAISREQDNSTHWLIRSRIETESGRLRPAVRDYVRAMQLHPHALVFALAPYFEAR
jgi:tetratricopeptide (TPR) repeat protein